VDYLLFCTQSPDYFLPTTACLVQDRLGLPTTTGAIDINQGCSGFVYGLGLAKGLIESGQAKNVLFITAETYSKFINPGDKSVRSLFGDAAAATLVSGVDSEQELIGPMVYGTDGRGSGNLIVPTGGMRRPREVGAEEQTDESGNTRSVNDLFMNGPEIFNFTLKTVPASVARLLDASGRTLDEVDAFVFHQANQYMLEHLRKKLALPAEKFIIAMSHCGNTVSSTIPLALKSAAGEGRIRPGSLVMLVGFGVGYSWGATFVRWTG
jgi:3-oxoacyl-[acyl-carrier-protein] synthase-3